MNETLPKRLERYYNTNNGEASPMKDRSINLKARHGFTIVELLIVIVVIAILASISVVAYRGIQSRAHDAAIRSDFRNVYNLLELYRSEHGSYPHDTVVKRTGGISSAIRDQLATIDMKLSVNSYDTTSEANTNVLYLATVDGEHYALLGYAKGNPTYYITDSHSSARVYEENSDVPQSRYPHGNPGGIGDNLGMPDIAPFYIYNKTGPGGWRIWD